MDNDGGNGGDAAEREAPASGGAGEGRDLVRLYSGLIHSLEEHCGAGALADRLAEARRTPDADAPDASGEAALLRCFRRLGIAGAGRGGKPDSLFDGVAGAVDRPLRHVERLFLLFCRGGPSLKPICGATPRCRLCRLTRECGYFNNPRKPETAALPPAKRLLSGNGLAASDAELLAVLLFGERGCGSEPAVRALMDRFGRLRAVFRADPREYLGMRDMTPAAALKLAAAGALYGRVLEEKRAETLRITSAGDLHGRYRAELRDHKTEAAVLAMLDDRGHVIRDAWFCEGSADVSRLGVGDLLRPAVREAAAGIALAHNHPSGDSRPSQSEIDFTRRLQVACGHCGLTLVDHVVVAENSYFSFAERGMLGGSI